MMPLKEFLDKKVEEYERLEFVNDDPISVPHLFTNKQDIEIAAFFAAVFAWGNRKTIIAKSKELMSQMDNAPFDFIRNLTPKALQRLKGFKHRTFNDDDLYYFVEFFHQHYSNYDSLENAFLNPLLPDRRPGGGDRLIYFKNYFFSHEHLKRTEKHISSPLQKSTCKRLNMFLRWMVRNNKKGVDFGLWKSISPADLICPIDLHVARVAKKLRLLKRKHVDWLAAVELTDALRQLDKDDPVKYDFALFNLGVIEKF